MSSDYTGPTQGPEQQAGIGPFGITDNRFAKGAENTMIYTGPREHPGPWRSGYVPFGTTTSAADLEASLYQMDRSELTAFQDRLYQAGYLNKGDVTGTVDDHTRSQFGQLLQDTYLYNEQGLNITWQDVLDRRNASLAEQGLGAGGVRSTQTQSEVQYTDPLAARKLAHDTFSNDLGRAPNRKEQAAFEAGLRAYEQAHPTVSTGTGLGTGTVNSTTQTGANEQGFAANYTHSTQALANEQGSQAEVGFVNVLQRLMGG